MKIQGLAVLAIIIILPMSIILNVYSRSQIKTLDLQIQYDSKLQNATYDAIKAFQLNMSNSSTSDITNSKMRDINASINTFFNTLSGNFNMSGYGKDVLQEYVPAIVYTLYDGYYIYSAYDNTLDPQENFYDDATYKDGEKIYGLKPYIYYSCRYKMNNNSDFVITYSLDSYITIQGRINGNPVNESGYLLTGVDRKNDGTYTYRGVDIISEDNKEGLRQNVYVSGNMTGDNISIRYNNQVVQVGSILNCYTKKINGVKYYQKNSDGKTLAIINDTPLDQNNIENVEKNSMGIEYYKKAYEFKEKFKAGGVLEPLTRLVASDAINEYGESYNSNETYYNYSIFNELFNTTGKYIEDSDSDFNAHKLQVIKHVIESNLTSAISNYNKTSTSAVNFAMPKLKESEWEELTQNIGVITFLQGLNIGGKVYNGYSIVINNINEDYVPENSIYILNNGEYHKVTDSDLVNNTNAETIGILNSDFEIKSTTDKYTDQSTNTEYVRNIYYSPRNEYGCYNSIINSNSQNNNTTNVYEYFKETNSNPISPLYRLAQIYYTALGRERWGMYRVTNKLEYIEELKK